MTEILRSFSAVYNWDSYKPEQKTIVSLGEEEMNSLAGQYLLTLQGNELILEISVLEKHLKGVQLWNDFPFEVYPESKSRFFNKDDGTEFEFSMEEDENTTGITIYEGSQEYFFQKI